MITNNTNTHKTTLLTFFQGGGYYQWIYAKVYATRTRISIGGVQDRDTL